MQYTLKNIKEINSLIKNDKEKEYLTAFNGTCTKMILVKQAKTRYEIKEFESLVDQVLVNHEN